MLCESPEKDQDVAMPIRSQKYVRKRCNTSSIMICSLFTPLRSSFACMWSPTPDTYCIQCISSKFKTDLTFSGTDSLQHSGVLLARNGTFAAQPIIVRILAAAAWAFRDHGCLRMLGLGRGCISIKFKTMNVGWIQHNCLLKSAIQTY